MSNTLLLKFFILSLFLMPTFSYAELIDDFKQAYQNYQLAAQTSDSNDISAAAKKAASLGCQYYGTKNINCINLKINQAHSLSSEDNKEAAIILMEVADAYIEHYGQNSVEVADLSIQIADKSYDTKNTAFQLDRAIGIADSIQQKSPLSSAQIKLEAGKVSMRKLYSNKQVLLEAYALYMDKGQEDIMKVLESRFWAAKYYQFKKQHAQAIPLLEENIAALEAMSGPTNPFELMNRAFVIKSLERNWQRDEATKHCIAIGKATPWEEGQDIQPLYRVEPRYPISAARDGLDNSVELTFVIDEFGLVKDAKVKGYKSKKYKKEFKKVALDALKQWRYSPRFKNGEAVATAHSVILDFKVIS